MPAVLPPCGPGLIYFATACGVKIGFHRMLTHRAFETYRHRAFETYRP